MVDGLVGESANTRRLATKTHTQWHHFGVGIKHCGIRMTQHQPPKEGIAQLHIPCRDLQRVCYLVDWAIADVPQQRPLGDQVELTAQVRHQLPHGGVRRRRPLE